MTAPGLSNSGTYYAVVIVTPDPGLPTPSGSANYFGWTQFDVYTSTTFTDTARPPGPGFDFSLTLSPSSLSVTPGGTANYQIFITYSNPSYAGTTIMIQGVTGLGEGMNYQIIPSPPGLSISTSSWTPPGSYNIILTGSAMGIVRQTSATLLVQSAEQPFDFSIMVSPSQQTVAPGGSTSYTVTVSLVSGDAHRAAVVSAYPVHLRACPHPLTRFTALQPSLQL